MEVEVDPKKQEQIRFAKLIADRLEQGRVDNAFEHLVLVAAPMFLGLLRANFGTPLSALVSLEMDKDYTTLRPEELRARLPARLLSATPTINRPQSPEKIMHIQINT